MLLRTFNKQKKEKRKKKRQKDTNTKIYLFNEMLTPFLLMIIWYWRQGYDKNP